MVLAKHGSVDGRADKSLFISGLRFIELRLRQLQIGLGERAVLLARVIVNQGMLLPFGLVLRLGNVGFPRVAPHCFASHYPSRLHLLPLMLFPPQLLISTIR